MEVSLQEGAFRGGMRPASSSSSRPGTVSPTQLFMQVDEVQQQERPEGGQHNDADRPQPSLQRDSQLILQMMQNQQEHQVAVRADRSRSRGEDSSDLSSSPRSGSSINSARLRSYVTARALGNPLSGTTPLPFSQLSAD